LPSDLSALVKAGKKAGNLKLNLNIDQHLLPLIALQNGNHRVKWSAEYFTRKK